MYDKIKVLLNSLSYRHAVIGGIGIILVLCAGYILYQPSGSNYQRTINAVERAQEQQRESIELNRSVQRSIDRSTELSREAKERIGKSQSGLSEARSYLERNAELFDRIERANRQRQENNQTLTDATQLLSDGGSGSDNRSSNSSMTER